MSSKRVLIIGGNGFIGMNLARTLVEKGHAVCCLDLVCPSVQMEGVTYLSGDFFDEEVLSAAVRDRDVIVHALSTINPSNSNEKYMQGYERDFLQTVRLCELASAQGSRLIFLSSGGTVYGNQSLQPITEGASTNPINHYASLKLCIENVIRAFCAQKKLKAVVARISNPYGPGQDYHRGVGFIDAVLKKSLNDEVMEIWGDGETVRDYVAIRDVCEMLTVLMDYQGTDVIFNISSGRGISQNDILRLLKENGICPQIVYKEYRNVDLRRTVLDNSKIMALYGKPLTAFEDGLMEYYHWLKGQRASI